MEPRHVLGIRGDKAIKLADALERAHCDAATATALSEEGWVIACRNAGYAEPNVETSLPTRSAVVAILMDRERRAA